jgi:O-antigen/teichoic acid export membrane protein
MSGILVSYTLRVTGLGFSFEKAKVLTSFSLPLVLTGLISFFITFGDRYFLRYYANLSEVGIYALAYKFGFLLMFLIVQPFSNHWDSEKYTIMKKPNARQIYQQTFLVYSTLVIFFVVLVSLFVKDLLKIMSDSSFWPASRIAPVVMLAYVFNAWANYTNLGIFAKNRTIEITYGTLIGAVVVAAGYIILIPRFGSMGAAWASVFGFGSRFLWITMRSQRLYDMQLPWGKVLVILFLGIAMYTISLFGPEENILSLCSNFLIMTAFISTIMLLPILPGDWRRLIFFAVTKPWRILRIKRGAPNSY